MPPSDFPDSEAARSPAKLAEAVHPAWENLFDISPDAILVTDPQGIIRGANPRASELFGYPPAELLGKPIEILIPRQFRAGHPRHRENYEAHPRTRQMGAAFRLSALRKDGAEIPVDIMLKPMDSPGGRVTLSFIRDITEQRQAEQAARQSDQLIRSMVSGIRDYAIYVLDPQGNVKTWNPGAERTKGYSEEEILGAHFSRFFTHEDQERGRPAELLHLAAERGRIELEGWRVRKDGSRFWANVVLTVMHDDTGALTGFVKITRDFTDRKRADEAVMLQLSSALLANMDVSKLLDAISASIREVIPHDAATLAIVNEDATSFAVQFLGGDQDQLHRGRARLPLEGSPAGKAFFSREAVSLENLDAAGFSVDAVQHLTSLGMRSGCWVPLIHHGEAVGVLAAARRTEGAFSPHEIEMLTQIAGQVAVAVSNASVLRHVSELRDRLTQEKKYLEEEINLENRFEDIVGDSPSLRQVLKEIETVAPTDATVLIQGETGTGKELLARAIHRLSPRSESTFVKLNCAAIPAGLLESELFGHEKGAFTGAIARKMGRLELAHEGTLFLDEIGEMPLELQPKLLRAIQEREIERLGGSRPIPVNIRLIAATNRDLAAMVAEKQFRADLFYRLKVFPIFAPPLRERAGDIALLAQHFVAVHSRRMGKIIESIPDSVMTALTQWPWPGNIRELENFLERCVILTRGPVLYAPLAELEMSPADEESSAPVTAVAAAAADPTLHEAEVEHILRVLRETRGQIGGDDGAAARLGVKRTTLNSKLQKLGIDPAKFR
ncbi:PAS domain S-box protein [Acidobacteria bacterium AB60]|nr:PAS domain S-box protein [Acidobacteria bacterium AB60]